MQKHEDPPGRPDDKRPKKTTAWWLGLLIAVLLGMVVTELLKRWT